MESLMWVIVLLTLFLYIFAVLAKSFFGNSGEIAARLERDGVDADNYFGTIPQSMVTLIGLCTYDNSISIQRAIGEVYPHAWLYFAAFMVVVSIGVMELMNGIFIEALMDEKKKIDRERAFLAEAHRAEVDNLMLNLFKTYDVDKDGSLDQNELDCLLYVFRDPEAARLMQEVGIEAKRMEQALHVADIDCQGCVTLDAFAGAVESLHEPPMRLHLAMVQRKLTHHHKQLKEELKKQIAKIADALESMDARMARLELNDARMARLEAVLLKK